MSDHAPVDLSLRSVLRENAALAIMYALGTILVALLWWPLGLIYLGYCLLSNVLYMAWICPYCPHYIAATCPAGYQRISGGRFQARAGKTFSGQFRYGVIMLFPGWSVPPVVGLYLLVTNFTWLVVALMALFCVVGFLILPVYSRRNCEGCENEACPRRKSKPATGG